MSMRTISRSSLIDQMIAICEFEGIPYQMSPELIDRAWANMFVKEEDHRTLTLEPRSGVPPAIRNSAFDAGPTRHLGT